MSEDRGVAPGHQVALEFLGSGDCMGTGGRLQPCLLLSDGERTLLLDCGATALVALKRRGLDPDGVEAVVLSHLHGDHFGGLPNLVLDGQISRRTRPLLVAGPPGTRSRVEAAMEVLFPGSVEAPRRFELRFVELTPGIASAVAGATVLPFEADHASGAPAFILRVTLAGRTVAYSGDTAWTEQLVEASRGADLLICEAYSFEKRIRYHLDHATLLRERARLGGRVVLTHLGPELLARIDEVPFECARDGLRLEV